MGVDLLQTGVSGLLTAQQQLATTGHNMANVNTDGFSRQRIIQETTTPSLSGPNFAGTGTKVKQIQRVFDQFRYNELVFNQTTNNFADTKANKLNRLDETMSLIGPETTKSLNDLFSAVNAVVDVPGDIGLREVLMGKVDTLTQNVKSMQRSLDAELGAVNDALEISSEQITAIAGRLAAINRDIVTVSAGQATPNDLMDTRDALINELAQYTTVTSIATADGATNVYIADGQTLVTSTTAFAVKTVAGSPDAQRIQIVIESAAGNLQPVNGSSIGGSLGALIDYRDGILTDTINKLGLTAMGISDSFNDVQSQGMDLNGLVGQNMFTDINDAQTQVSRFVVSPANTGDQAGAIQIDDISKLTGDDYRVSVNGGNYTMTNLRTGNSQLLGAVGGGPFATTEGFTFTETSGTALNGDRFEIQPTRPGASAFALELTSAEQIAASSMAEVYASSDNVNSASLEIVRIDNPGDVNFPSSINDLSLEVYEAPAGTFNYQLLNGAGTPVNLFDSAGAPLGVSTTTTSDPFEFKAAGMSFKLSGKPTGQTVNAPEVYAIEFAFGVGNNKNILAMAQLNEQKVLNNGRSTITDLYQTAITDVGSEASAAKIEAAATQTLFEQANARMLNTSGVNLDEEASSLLRFQQAYSASARIISTANEIFQTLLQVTG